MKQPAPKLEYDIVVEPDIIASKNTQPNTPNHFCVFCPHCQCCLSLTANPPSMFTLAEDMNECSWCNQCIEYPDIVNIINQGIWQSHYPIDGVIVKMTDIDILSYRMTNLRNEFKTQFAFDIEEFTKAMVRFKKRIFK